MKIARAPQDWFLVVLGVVLLHVVLALPSHPSDVRLSWMLVPTWELPALVALLALFPHRALRGAVVAAATLLAVLRLADIGTNLAFSRPFNPLLDLHLLRSGWSLLASSVGYGQALVAIAGVLAAVALLAAAMWICLSRLPRVPVRMRAGAAAVPLALALLAAALPGWQAVAAGPAIAAQVQRISTGVADLAAFTAQLEAAPQGRPGFAALRGRDVVVAFVESYGRSFVDDPVFSQTALPRLDAVTARLEAAGWHAASAWASAPTRGGQSWLSHGTLLSGLWVDNQQRYDRLMISQRASLNGLFGEAGWRTAAVMPAITLDWPEAAWYRYDTLKVHANLGYAGEPFEWVTMPDQYTWTALDRLRGADPVMIEVALITSHAPWTPLPEIVPWDEVGDGSIFDGTRRAGDTPRVVWSDPETIRAQYAKSLDYALEVMGQYIARDGRGAVFIVLGDHQPAALLTGQDAPPDVPVHIIADDPRLLDLLPPDLFVPGMVPGADAEAVPMNALHGIVTTVFEDAH